MILHEANPLLLLALVLMCGAVVGELARRLRLPAITGYILAGVLLGRHGLDVLQEESWRALHPLTDVALGLMAVEVGAHLNFRRLRNAAKRLGLLMLAEATVTPVLVFAGLMLVPGMESPTAAMFATLAISTAPATVVAIVKEARAKGVFVKTLLASVALNNMTCIFLFELARAVARVELDPSVPHDLLTIAMAPAVQLGGAFLLGGGVGLVLVAATRQVKSAERIGIAGVLAILFTVGAAASVGLSPLLTCVFLGLAQTNFIPARDQLVDRVFTSLEPAILVVFFTLAGLHLSIQHAGGVLLIAALFVSLRIAGKVLSAALAMRLAGATESVRRHLGPALVPQAGVAVGLVILVQNDASLDPISDLFAGVVLTAVTVAEIVGPVLTRTALVRSGELGRDRPRLIDFIGEQNIVIDLDAPTKEAAIEVLADHLIRSKHLKVTRDALLSSIFQREAQASTCLGGGLAIPHGDLSEGDNMVGVLGISREGLRFDTPDGRPVHCMVLLATPEGERERHLEVLAGLARALGKDERMMQDLMTADSPAHAYEILHGDEAAEGFNYYLEDR